MYHTYKSNYGVEDLARSTEWLTIFMKSKDSWTGSTLNCVDVLHFCQRTETLLMPGTGTACMEQLMTMKQTVAWFTSSSQQHSDYIGQNTNKVYRTKKMALLLVWDAVRNTLSYPPVTGNARSHTYLYHR